jgi:SAM-dependent methyltransferase
VQQDSGGTEVHQGAVQPGDDRQAVGSPIRLDIGAGHKKEPGWIRVDQPITRKAVYKNRADAPDEFALDPDIPCDIRAIPLPDDYADEARAIHVIEHFYAWEALDLVKEWVRVLKPGAKLAIECPCLDKVLALANVPQVPPDFVHWALYGDPRYKDPSMCHKWIYNQVQLVKLMTQAGLEGVEPAFPKYHQPIRDMRVVGRKPLDRRIVTP